MNGLQTIKKNNQAAIRAYLNNADPSSETTHLLRAPKDERFDFNIPWHFNADDRVLHVHVHEDTKMGELIKLKRLVAAEYEAQRFRTVEHLYL
jgi:hypothetical protein